MKEFIKLLAEVVNAFHDGFILLAEGMGLKTNDKILHFWVIGILGIILFIAVHILFRQLAKWSLTVLSIIYTFTVMLVIVFAIEIQQGITNRGNMEFQDAVYGIWGFIVFLSILLLATGMIKMIYKWFNRKQS